MDFYQIRYFLTLVETGNFTKAAEKLFISQPSLSAGIKKLERELGVVLFERGGRKTVLTPAGQYFLNKAQKFVKDYQSLKLELERFKEQPILRIGVLHTIRNLSLSELIGKFREKYPHVVIKLYNGHLEDLENWLEIGTVDLALTWVRNIDAPETSQILFQQPLKLAVHPSHLFSKRNSITLNDLHHQPYIERLNCEFWRSCPRIFESAGIEPQIVYSANDEELVISLIQADLGMSIMPFWKDLNNLIYISIDDLNLTRNMGLKWRTSVVSDLLENFRSLATLHNWQV